MHLPYIWGLFAGIVVEASSKKDIGFAGDQATVTLSPVSNIEPDSISIGYVLCRGGQVIFFFLRLSIS